MPSVPCEEGEGEDRLTIQSRRRLILLGLLLGMWLATSACACANMIGGAVASRDEAARTPVTLAPPPSPTPSPSPSPTPTLLTATKTPSVEPVHGLGSLPRVLEQPNALFAIEVTQAELNEYLAGEMFDLEGALIEDVQIIVTENGLVCSFRATQQDSGLSAGLTIRGMPTVAGGAAYFRVDDVTLDPSVKGFARLIAKATIEGVIKQYSTPHGIPIPVERVEFHDIQLMPGKILIAGRTRYL